ncbi:tail fiber domain-containing protein, partial [Fusobacterium varium]|nr:tail fiber domain-containing protein [Fusobacterium varium]
TFPPDSHTHPYLSTSGGTVNGNLTVTGQIVSNGDVTAFSDRELKENIQPLKDNFLDKLQVYSYNYIGEKDIRYGVIAQELQEFYPNLVLETDREVNGRKVLAVRDRDIIYLLLDAYQKLSKRVSELERGE